MISDFETPSYTLGNTVTFNSPQPTEPSWKEQKKMKNMLMMELSYMSYMIETVKLNVNYHHDAGDRYLAPNGKKCGRSGV
jgi:hypothetical protein